MEGKALEGLRASYLVILRGGDAKLFRSAKKANAYIRKKPRYAAR